MILLRPDAEEAAGAVGAGAVVDRDGLVPETLTLLACCWLNPPATKEFTAQSTHFCCKLHCKTDHQTA